MPPPPPTLPGGLDADGSRVTFDPASRVRPVLERDGLWTMLDGAGQELGLTAVNVAPPSGRTGTQAESAVAAWLGDAGPWTVVADRELTTPLARASAGSPVARMLLLILAYRRIANPLAGYFIISTVQFSTCRQCLTSRRLMPTGSP